MGKLTKEESIEQIRKALVSAMRVGDRLVLNCGKYVVDFMKDFHCPINLPIKTMFNFTEWRKDEVYKRIVREEEDVDTFGNKRCYFMNENFCIVILCDVRDMREGDGSD